MSDAQPNPSRGPVVLSVLIMALGVGWLLTSLGVGPGINWVWTIGLGITGVLVFVLSGGLDKCSIVVGPFFLLASGLSILRQTDRIDVNVQVPVLVIVIGVLLLVAQSRRVPIPRWCLPAEAGPGRN
ncbi:MAG: hypothetical protein AAF750_17170 [Planctomycetota bacterium]